MQLDRQGPTLDIAVIGTGIAGMAAAWLLAERHRVTVYEGAERPGGHSHTVTVDTPTGSVAVDTGFIVYNDRTYPNLSALFRLLDVPTQPSIMSFSVSLDDGALEYSGSGANGFFGQRRNLLRPGHWRMLRDILRFYREAPTLIDEVGDGADPAISLGDYLGSRGYSREFSNDHLLPMAAAIWSTPMASVRDYPASEFIRFCANHGLLTMRDRPQWRTVVGGCREYVRRLTARYADRIRFDSSVAAIIRDGSGVTISDRAGTVERYDRAVIAVHADQALALLDDPTESESELLGAFRYQRNLAELHGDSSFMPRRRAVWSSWNYLGHRNPSAPARLSVTYWLNRLHGLNGTTPLFVTLNPDHPVRPDRSFGTYSYDHPVIDSAATHAQRQLWRLQGVRNTWFCGAYFGAGFHEDGLQAGLAVAEALGGVRRPWRIGGEHERIHRGASVLEPQSIGAAS
jgi:predicted NAD/FAD-binding protein